MDLSGVARTTIANWRADPVLFVHQALGAEPEPWQKQALEYIAVEDRLTIRSGHGVGKTTLLSWIILWFMLTRYPVKVPTTAPTAHQLFDVLWPEISFWHRRLPAPLQKQLVLKSDRLELSSAPRESFAVARTARAEQPEALQGFHSMYILYIVDEASGVPDPIFETARGAMSTPGAKSVLAGNPTRGSGYFFETHKPGSGYVQMKVSCSESSRVDPGFIKEMARDYGEESNVFRIRVLGEFPRSEDDVLIPLDLIEAAVARYKGLEKTETPSGMFKSRRRIYGEVWGVDVGHMGSDESVLVKRRGPVVNFVKGWRQLNNMELAGRLKREWDETIEEERPASIFVDYNGVGVGVCDRLWELDLPVVGINVSELPGVLGRGWRLRDELWIRTKDFFELSNCAIPDHQKLVKDLSEVTYKVGSDEKFRIEPKPFMRKRLKRSPDYGDALCMTFSDEDVVSLVSPKARDPWGKTRNIDQDWVA